MPNTIRDLWRMACLDKSPVIVMITKLKEKNKVRRTETFWGRSREQDFPVMGNKYVPGFDAEGMGLVCRKNGVSMQKEWG